MQKLKKRLEERIEHFNSRNSVLHNFIKDNYSYADMVEDAIRRIKENKIKIETLREIIDYIERV